MTFASDGRGQPPEQHSSGSALAPDAVRSGQAAADLDDALLRILTDALLGLGRLGAPERANRLAGEAWSALRNSRPELAQRVNALMHGIAKMPSDPTRDDKPPEDKGAESA